MTELIFKDESYRIVGACFAVYNDKGHAFTEPIYHECLEIEFAQLGLPFHSKPPITLTYRGRTLTHAFIPDFVCFERIVVEIKAVSTLTDEHRAQVINYVNAADFALGLLINFGHFPKVQFERYLPGQRPPKLSPSDIVL